VHFSGDMVCPRTLSWVNTIVLKSIMLFLTHTNLSWMISLTSHTSCTLQWRYVMNHPHWIVLLANIHRMVSSHIHGIVSMSHLHWKVSHSLHIHWMMSSHIIRMVSSLPDIHLSCIIIVSILLIIMSALLP